jgi:hypothetical protein
VIVHAHAGLPRAEALAAEIGGSAFACDLADVPAMQAALEAVLAAARCRSWSTMPAPMTTCRWPA